MTKTILRNLYLFILILLLTAQLPAARGQEAASVSQPKVIDSSNMVPLRGNTHPFALAKDQVGLAPDGMSMERMLLVLQRDPARQKALDDYLVAQHVKGSATFHQWLKPEEFGTRFGLADADIQAITQWLATNGFQVKRISSGRSVIEFSGTAGQIRQAFGTEIRQYALSGKNYWANSSDPQIPAALAPFVAGVVSMNNFATKVQSKNLGSFAKSTTGQLTPLFTFPGTGCSSTGICYGVGPQDFATIYNVAPLWAAGIDGTGQAIAIASDSNIRLKDVQSFRSLFALPAKDPIVILNGPDPGVISPNELEANIDVQWTGAVAKNADIKLVVSQSTEISRGVDLSALYIVDNNIAPVMLMSFGECEAALGSAGNAFYSLLWQQAAAEGITVVIPTGDTGSAACENPHSQVAATHGRAVNGVAATPYNVAVGGTDFDQVGKWSQYWNATNDGTTQASAKSYIPETTWNDTCTENGLSGCATVSASGSDLIAGGGGLSTYYNKPAWQTGNGVPHDGVRDIPDVALFSGDGNNGSFYIICQQDALTGTSSSCDLSAPYQNFVGVGGTSASASAFAGVMALVNQKTGATQGDANFVLYPLAKTVPAAFHDITKGGNSVACVAGSPDCNNTGTGYGVLEASNDLLWPALPGFDLVTGLGSFDANALVNSWSSVTFSPTTTTLSNVTPTTFTHGQAISFQIAVASTGGTPTGNVALMVKPATGNSYAVDTFPLSNGSFSGSSTFLPGGTYNIFARYGGDGVFGTSDSAPVPVTVSAQSSFTVLSVVFHDPQGNVVCNTGEIAVSYGFPYAVRADVNLSGIPCVGPRVSNAPTGTITLTENGAPAGAGTYTLNSRGGVEDRSAAFSVGSHPLLATYSGDSSYGPSNSNSNPLILDVTQATATVVETASASSVPSGSPVTITATIGTQSIAAAPTGNVTFSSDSGTLGTATLIPGGPNGAGFVSATAKITFSPTNTVNVVATYSGDVNYSGASSTPITITSGTPDFTATASPSPLVITAGKTGTATVTLTPTLGFTGSVSIACPAASALPVGVTCNVAPASVPLNGSPATATVTIGTTAPTILSASNIEVSPVGNPSRPFLFVAAGFVLAGLASFAGFRRGGPATLCVLAIFSTVFVFSCADAKIGSPGASLSINSTSPKAALGAPVTLKAFVATSHDVTGTVTFSDGGAPLGAPATLASGRANITTSALAIGTHAITASYSGDSHTPALSTTTPFNQVITGGTSLQLQITSGTLSHPLTLNVTIQ